MMKSRLRVISHAVVALSMVVATTAPATAADVPAKQHPQELGAIDWGRDFDAALARGKRENKPVLVLFQEVPGCSTCTTYGDVVLSQRLRMSHGRGSDRVLRFRGAGYQRSQTRSNPERAQTNPSLKRSIRMRLVAAE